MKFAVSAFCTALFTLTSFAVHSETILFEDFEDSTVTYTATPPDNLSDLDANDYFGRFAPDISPLPLNIFYTNIQGNGFYGVQDIDGVPEAPGSLVELNFSGIDLSLIHI